jgi:soluble lytic murein transglycosylase-like protein
MPIALSVYPPLMRTVARNPKGAVATTVAKVVATTLGTEDPVEAERILAADPARTAALRAALLQIDLEHREPADRMSGTAWVAPALSLVVTVGFFVVLMVFVLNKNFLERSPLPASPEILATLDPAVIAALPRPSDFVIQIINICVGALTAAFATVMSFWLGSSSGSQAKDRVLADLQTTTVESANERASSASATPPPAGPAPAASRPEPQPAGGPAVRPARPDLFLEELPALTAPHRTFPGSVEWSLTPDGVSVDGAPAARTVGSPDTMRGIWERYGALCAEAAKFWGVPVELVVATIANESRGEPGKRETSRDGELVGVMQTPLAVARRVTGRGSLEADELLDPRTSINAGAAYISQQRGSTHFDPPLVAAAYDAGSIRRDEDARNRWRLQGRDAGAGDHIDSFVNWFGDAMQVSRALDWGKDGVPSFATALPVPPPAGG